MRAVFSIARETSLRLRRDKVFFPVLVISLMITGFANVASNWSIEDFAKILFDVGSFGFQITGTLIAIFWGTKIVVDSRKEGEIELQLAAPIDRGEWFVGKYLGLAATLVILGVSMTGLWQVGMLMNNFGMMSEAQALVFLFHILAWLVVAALAVFFASFCGVAVAMFCTFGLWISGIMSGSISAALPPQVDEGTRRMAALFSRVWNFQQLNLVEFATVSPRLPTQEVWLRGFYALGVVLILLTASTLIFQKRDFVGGA